MNIQEYEKSLIKAIRAHGYWSDEVFNLNNQLCAEHGETKMYELNNTVQQLSSERG